VGVDMVVGKDDFRLLFTIVLLLFVYLCIP